MLDDVERRLFLVEPAGEDAVPALVLAAHVHLHEGAGQPVPFPGGGALAGAQADRHLPVDARGLAGLERDLALDAVALVEHAEYRDARAHRRRGGIHGGIVGAGRDGIDALRVAAASNHQLVTGIVAGSAVAASATRTSGQREREQRRRSLHASGVQAS
ncbi:hypothetical protein GCM10009075_11810 [Sphingomonas trueperi]